MKAIGIRQFGGREVIETLELPIPEVRRGEMLLKIKAAGVNPVDWKIRQGLLQSRMPHTLPIVLGWDAAGVIEKTGAGVSKFKPGDEVFAYCRKESIHDGTYAEYITVTENQVALKPESLSFPEAASIPLAALTAYQALLDAGRMKRGEVVLVHAAAGGVGTFAVQIAKYRGAKVIGTASSQNHEYVKALGAQEVIDYQAVDFREAVRSLYPDGIDMVIDCVGGDYIEKSMDVLKKKGRLVSIVGSPNLELVRQKGVDFSFVFVAPNAKELQSIAKMVDNGYLKTTVAASFPFSEAAKAHELIEGKHTRGKIVLTIE